MMLEYEHKLLKEGYTHIIGIDEAGRGPLAGPVCVASVMMPLDEESIIDGINDSKKLSAKMREKLFNKIIEKAIDYKIVFIDEQTIDSINILNATKLGMKQCIDELHIVPDYVLIDAVKGVETNIKNLPIIKGDQKSYLIAAASILAKVSRDKLMLELANLYPQYEFEKHKGYGTSLHIEKIKKYGPCTIHRKSFIKNFVGKEVC